MPRLQLSTRHATPQDIREIIALSRRVQDRLDENGSQQVSGPLSTTHVLDRIREERCYVLVNSADESIIGVAMVKAIEANYYEQSREFDVENFPPPWKLLHSFMIDPDLWGNGYGVQLFADTIDFVENTRCGGTVLLDCFAGNEHLREFYAKLGCLDMGTVPEPEGDWHVAVFARFLGPGPPPSPRRVEGEGEQGHSGAQ